MARYLYPSSHLAVITRSKDKQDFAMKLGADWAGPPGSTPPEPLDALIDTTPVWSAVVEGLELLAPAGYSRCSKGLCRSLESPDSGTLPAGGGEPGPDQPQIGIRHGRESADGECRLRNSFVEAVNLWLKLPSTGLHHRCKIIQLITCFFSC